MTIIRNTNNSKCWQECRRKETQRFQGLSFEVRIEPYWITSKCDLTFSSQRFLYSFLFFFFSHLEPDDTQEFSELTDKSGVAWKFVIQQVLASSKDNHI